MRNLSVRYEKDRTIDLSSSDDVAFHVDQEGNLVAVGKDAHGVKRYREQDEETIVIGGNEGDFGCCVRVIDLGDDTAIIAYDSGSIVLAEWNLGTTEVVGQVEGGVQDLQRSPDEELFLLITSNLKAVVMTREFDPIGEVDVDAEAASQFVSVGWGKKETQFHGSEGKAAAIGSKKKKPVAAVAEGDDEKARTVWRDDGQMFAVSYVAAVEEGIRVRRIRVFSREMALISTSERADGLEQCLAWKPAGSALLASTQRMPNKHQVAFFEKNGLRHGEFKLPFGVNDVVVTFLGWNRDADALIVCCRDKKAENRKTHLHVYTCSNYFWSLKQSWKHSQDVSYVQWDPMESLKFYFVTSDGTFKTVQLGWTIDHSTGTTDSDPAYAVNVDGNKVKVTPFRTMVVPPPISAFELHLPENVKQVAFAPEPLSSRLAVFTATNKMFTFSEEKTEDSEMSQDLVKVTGAGGNGFIVKCSLLHPVASLKLSWDGAALANWIWLAGDMMLASCNQPIPSLHLFEITKDGNLSPKEAFPVEDTVYNISRSSDGNVAAVQLVNGDILKYDAEKEEVSPSDPLPSVCPWTAVVKVGEDTHVLALSARHRLYRNGVEIAGNITSVNVHSDFILATTLKHTLKCLPLANLGAATKEAAWFSESSRALERGSKLVVTVPRDSQIVLQMPRGNLELIHPRALALNIVKGNLDALKYGVSMETLRKHRISLNLFVDHNPDLFLANVDKFVEEIKDVQRICLFVADLLKEDTTTTLYGSMYPDRAAYSNWPSASNKIDTVCARLKDRLEQDAERNILPILSCLIKSSDSDVDAALKRIDVMRTANPAVADDALDFLLLLVDVNALFDVALGLYDFDLVLFVAEKSQKDPKEYLPFLNEFKKHPLEFRKYRIDLHLKRHKKALKNLSEIGGGSQHATEALDLVRSQRLYKEGMEYFREGSNVHRDICRSYGDYLVTKKYYEDAALTYERGLCLNEAVGAWEKSLNWRLCLAMAQEISMHTHDVRLLCSRIVEALIEEKRYFDAAVILSEYLDDVEEAIAALVKGCCWAEAARMIRKANRADLDETHFLPAIQEHADILLNSTRNRRSTFEKNLERLRVVFDTKQKIASGLYEEVDVNVEDADLYSDTTSLTGARSLAAGSAGQKSNPASLKTRNTQRTKSSKNRRKQDRKKYSTKEGSNFEDLGLIAAQHEVVRTAYISTAEVGELTRALVKAGIREEAKTIQVELVSLLDLIKASVNQIWMGDGEKDSAAAGQEERVKFGPQATTADIIAGQDAAASEYTPQYSLLEPHLRRPPAAVFGDSWQLQTLS